MKARFSESETQSKMPEVGFRVPRDASPDSVIYTLESNFSLFSSASASVDRCSFASDAHDRDSLASEISLQLGGCDREHNESSSGPDPDLNPNKPNVHVRRSSRLSRKGEKAIVHKEYNNAADFGDINQTVDSARNSFSLALKECQERRSRSDALSKKPDRRRPVSVDFNNATALSPRFGVKKSSATAQRNGVFPSPGTPTYVQSMQRGWNSERVPLHGNGGRRHVNTALLPYNGGRTLPSKWEDAERWICSPVSGDGALRASHPQPQRRPKSKSGPLGPPGAAYYSSYSPAGPMFDGVNGGNFVANSPFSAGVIAGDGLATRSCGHGASFPIRADPCMTRSASVHGCSEVPNQASLPSEGDKVDGVKDAATNVSPDVSRRDMATQMSPEGSSDSSPKTKPSCSASASSPLPIVELQKLQSPTMKVRDVQVDDRVILTRWPKKNKSRIPRKSSEISDDWKQKGDSACAWSATEAAKSLSKFKREEAKITAWENLQKAKAEAAIRKLEMKLEKKRSSSMDKIMNKLRMAQKRAQEMRSSVLAGHANQVARTSHKAVSFRRTRQMSSLSGCFTCHAF